MVLSVRFWTLDEAWAALGEREAVEGVVLEVGEFEAVDCWGVIAESDWLDGVK